MKPKPIPRPDPLPPRRTERAVIALGANLGEREATLVHAIDDLAALPLTQLVAASSLVETVALTVDGLDENAPRYLNAVVAVDTSLAPDLLLAYLQRLEQGAGRVRAKRWDDRPLDLDLIVYGELIQDDPDLTIPHPRAHERGFVLEPWLEIDERAAIPGRGAVRSLLAALGDES